MKRICVACHKPKPTWISRASPGKALSFREKQVVKLIQNRTELAVWGVTSGVKDE